MENEKEVIGRIVEVIQHGRILPAFVVGTKGKRLRVLLPSGKEETVSSGQTLLLSRKRFRELSRNEILNILSRAESRRESLKVEIELPTLWELVVEEAESFEPYELAEIYFGSESGDDEAAALIRAVLEDKIYFRLRDGRISVHPREEVERLLLAKKREEERLQRLALGEVFFGKLIKGEEAPEVPKELREYFLSALRDYCLFGDEASRAKEIKEILARLKATGPETPFRLLVRAGVFHEDENLEILRFRIPVEFPEEVLSEAEHLTEKPRSREDLTHIKIFTIDAEETRDFDDALHFERLSDGFRVGVHITDVSALIPPDSATFREALRRGLTLYLPEGTIPMLPPNLSENRLSLRAGETRPAVSFLIDFSPEGDIRGFRILLSRVRVTRRLTYEEVDARIKEGDPFWTEFYHLAWAFSGMRRRAGAFAITLPEVVLRVKDGEIHLERLEFTPARLLVAEFMIAANFVAARFLNEKGIPALYRFQKEPLERILATGEENDLVKAFQQLRYFVRGEVGLSPEFHHGLGLPAYTTVTSPIRRVMDLVVQHQLSATLAGESPPFDEDRLREILVHLEDLQSTTAQVRSRTHRYWLLKYLRLHFQGRTVPALVLEAGERRARVLLPDFMLPVEMPLSPGLRLKAGDEIRVKILRINPRLDIIRVAPA
ncbi:RNB domain-containing ribonuclease [Thermosulfurimonas sp. F29]|uniref:RNB domain-containing ribonuclease n=1 Tax=Thermosulfurimonas sp. F29 TaxID=2867247 RepID=UPI001C83DB67|nr:RNB domain-containing ribonuclease [Thermosulfurimonas sp. F29]MBX6422350.1 RNB domain-containing ribonuclease [Thermosulfurimonas sp. F29]